MTCVCGMRIDVPGGSPGRRSLLAFLMLLLGALGLLAAAVALARRVGG